MSTISCAMIVRDAAGTLGRALESVRGHVDEIIVVDTGSIDNTREIAAQYADHVFTHEWQDSFSEARQYAHDLCSSEWVFFLDADDEVFGPAALRERVRTAPEHIDAYMIRYVLARDARGVPTTEFYRERLIRKDRMVWAGRVHEVMVPVAPPCSYERFEGTWVLHHGHGDGRDSMQRNIRLLEIDLAEQPDNTRTLFYLGRDYVQAGRLDAGIAMLERYQAVSAWPDERFMALLMRGHALRVQGNFLEAYTSDLRMLLVHPLWPQAWFSLAQDAYYLQLWPESIHYCEIGQGLPPPATNLFVSPTDLESGWMIYQAVSLWHAERFEEAAEVTIRALSLIPHDPHHQANAVYFQKEMEKKIKARSA